MKIAFLADTHLSDLTNTPQEEALDWALGELNVLRPDACVFLGDLTACGSPDAALRFNSKVSALSIPSLVVPGNSDLRTDATALMLERFLFSHPEGLRVGDLHIVGMDTSRDCILPEERERLSRLRTGDRILLCSHQPAKYLDPDSASFIQDWLRGQAAEGKQVLLWASGHRHKFETGVWKGIPTVSVRALDPDKCCGGSAQICLWDTESDTFTERVDSRGTPAEWSEADRQELADSLGITCYNRHKLLRDMPFAIRNRVLHLEWRGFSEEELFLIEQWRAIGGKTFSMHMTSLNYDRGVIGEAALRQAAENAIRAGADMITVHPPQIPHGQMRVGLPAFEATADAMAEALLPLAHAGIDILVENNHTDHGTSADPLLLPYGCTPIDLVGWRDALNLRLGGRFCHFRLDIGHARNNLPLSKDYPIGKWYASMGGECHAYHLHQTVHNKELNRMSNHHPITGLHDGLIAFDGFLLAWRTGILHHGPVILEIREGEGAPATWKRLRALLLDKNT